MKGSKKKSIKGSARVLSFERDKDFLTKRADSRRMQNDPVNAVKLYRAALEREPHDYDTRLALSDALTDMQRFVDSNHVLIPHMHEDEYFMKEAYCRVGFNYFGLNEYAAARRCFDRFFDLTDEVSERTDAIMDAIDLMDSFIEPRSMLEDASEMSFNIKLAEAHNAMSRGSYDDAKTELKKLASKHPDDIRVQHDLAVACMCCGEYDAGLEQIEKMISADETDVSALCMKLLYAHNVNDEVMLNSVCNRLAKCEGGLPPELVPMIGIILDAGKTELALELAKHAYKNVPYDSLTCHVFALSLIKAKDYKTASKLYEKLLNINNSDPVAKYYYTKCTEEHPDPAAFRHGGMIRYQLPITGVLENIKTLSHVDTAEAELITSWRDDPSFRQLVRWGFTLEEFTISYAMLNILKAVGDSEAQTIMREAIIDPGTNPNLVHEALGMLKTIGAEEPYFAFVNGELIEGRVNMLDLSEWHIPKQYRLIFPRFHSLAAGLYNIEVYSAASGIMERFLAGLGDPLPSIDEERSVALSAALEYFACKKCGVEVKEDILERYDVTERRFNNAAVKLLNAILPEGDNEDEDEDYR